MKVLREGHKYEMDAFEEGGEPQTIHFIEKVPEAPNETVFNGTTNEEVLKVMINRMQSLQARFPCRENAIVIINLEESLMWLEKRTADRKTRGVEGKQLK